jgi:acetyltransferase-like isoleucine patch superfamily enzyme
VPLEVFLTAGRGASAEGLDHLPWTWQSAVNGVGRDLEEMMDGRRLPRVLATALDPMTYFQVVRLLHYYSYSHVKPRRKLTKGPQTTIAPNTSLRNGERIVIGARTRVGERAYLWAGDTEGRITIGDDCRLGPEVFITASDYGLAPDAKITEQERNERDVEIGNDVWLGARVFVGAGVSIGDGSVVSAGSVVTKSLPPGSVAVGVPARIVRRREDYAGVGGGDEQERAEPQVTTSA